MLSLTAFADELEREQARQHAYDAMLRKARAGHVTGSRVFGYDNVEVRDAEGRRAYVERRINDAQAIVVRRIFDACAAGQGLRTIGKALNADSGWVCPQMVERATGIEPFEVIFGNAVIRRDLLVQDADVIQVPLLRSVLFNAP